MHDQHTDLGQIRATGAVVVRGTLSALDRFIRDVRARGDVQVIFVKTGAGRLKIVAEEERP